VNRPSDAERHRLNHRKSAGPLHVSTPRASPRANARLTSRLARLREGHRRGGARGLRHNRRAWPRRRTPNQWLDSKFRASCPISEPSTPLRAESGFLEPPVVASAVWAQCPTAVPRPALATTAPAPSWPGCTFPRPKQYRLPHPTELGRSVTPNPPPGACSSPINGKFIPSTEVRRSPTGRSSTRSTDPSESRTADNSRTWRRAAKIRARSPRPVPDDSEELRGGRLPRSPRINSWLGHLSARRGAELRVAPTYASCSIRPQARPVRGGLQ